MNLQENINRIKEIMGIITESSYEEAWELVGQEHPVIKNIVSDKGYQYDENSVEKLTPIFDNLPIITVSYNEIKDFKNLENKKNDIGLVEKMNEISKTDNPREGYRKFMMDRDKGEGRDRGYDPVNNFDNVVNGQYESPVILNVDNENYVIGGRTRLYASIASGSPIKIKILTPEDL